MAGTPGIRRCAPRRATGPTRRTLGVAPPARGGHRRPDHSPRGRLDRVGGASGQGCYRGQETVARVHNLGRLAPGCWCWCNYARERPATCDPLLVGGRTVGRLGTVVDHVDLGPIALALVKRGIPADTALTTGGEHPVAAAMDPTRCPRLMSLAPDGWRWTDQWRLTRSPRAERASPASGCGTVRWWTGQIRH